MKQIALISRLGNVALNIKASAITTEKAQEAAFLDSLTFRLFHKAGSKVYGKKGGHKRDEKFSENLAKDVKAGLLDVISDIFSEIEVITSEHVPIDPWDTLRKQMKSLSFSDAEIEKVIAAKREAVKPEDNAAEANTVLDADEALVG